MAALGAGEASEWGWGTLTLSCPLSLSVCLSWQVVRTALS